METGTHQFQFCVPSESTIDLIVALSVLSDVFVCVCVCVRGTKGVNSFIAKKKCIIYVPQ